MHKVDEQYLSQEFKNKVPPELLTFRYLMHPIRLSIMKMLASEHKMRSSEIKHVLDIAWGELSNHLKSLEEKGFVELVDEFNEYGHIVQTVYIVESGRKEFQELYEVLKQFTSDESPFGTLIHEEEATKRDNLYPNR